MDVEEDELRLELRGRVEAGGPVLGLADDGEALGLEDGPGIRAKARMVVDDQDVHVPSIVAPGRRSRHTASRTFFQRCLVRARASLVTWFHRLRSSLRSRASARIAIERSSRWSFCHEA